MYKLERIEENNGTLYICEEQEGCLLRTCPHLVPHGLEIFSYGEEKDCSCKGTCDESNIGEVRCIVYYEKKEIDFEIDKDFEL